MSRLAMSRVIRWAVVPVVAAVGLFSGVALAGGATFASAADVTTTIAGTVIMDKEGTGEPAETWFVATPGVTNNVAVREIGPNSVEISDTAGPLVAGLDCEQVDTNTVRCTWTGRVRIYAGDGHDTVDARSNAHTSVYGGPGNDTLLGGNSDSGYLFGGAGNDVLTGTTGVDWIRGDAGNDTIEGNAGNDHLYGGEGNDTVNAGPGNDQIYEDLGKDVIVGDAGNDTVSYDRSAVGVNVSLDGVANDGAPNEQDNISAENVVGTHFADILRGDGLDNKLFGREGYDELYGNDGNDYLDALDGPGHINGGNGSDTCLPAMASVTRLACTP